MSNLHPLFENILKPHLQDQTVIVRQRIHPDDAREAFGVLVLHFGGATADTREAVELYRRLEASWDRAVLALGAAQERRERVEAERSLDRQYAYEQYRKAKAADEFEKTAPKPDSYYLGTKCWRESCGHARGEHDKAGCRGGEDTICRCTDFEEPVEDEQEAAREERRQYRAWRNDSGV